VVGVNGVAEVGRAILRLEAQIDGPDELARLVDDDGEVEGEALGSVLPHALDPLDRILRRIRVRNRGRGSRDFTMPSILVDRGRILQREGA